MIFIQKFHILEKKCFRLISLNFFNVITAP